MHERLHRRERRMCPHCHHDVVFESLDPAPAGREDLRALEELVTAGNRQLLDVRVVTDQIHTMLRRLTQVLGIDMPVTSGLASVGRDWEEEQRRVAQEEAYIALTNATARQAAINTAQARESALASVDRFYTTDRESRLFVEAHNASMERQLRGIRIHERPAGNNEGRSDTDSAVSVDQRAGNP